ncbi:calcium-binding mitochondrial carrier protein SCaMC-2 isoform X2 [Toxorhynchites rutilus septentrionalis]|uniref:calcium-binding mitochondrial carrier protein SCaMC-2 isoform X2 n=1 Tax=Toxorhynchites rutilus septentrionalis TaxID=329112 RepID=UPI00247B0999|nr:calcium-binding mitochondrial carrier protein SCaMC-2 isoform X2 [Toxorhynchites rutilus septentrionalis]
MVNLNGTADNTQGLPPVHYLHELPQADEERLEKIFNKLDRDGNGRIDIHDLSSALKEFGLSHQYAERFLKQSDQTQSGDVGLAEFIHYVREHEKNLRLQFTHLDRNRDGMVDLEELITAFKELGIEIDRHEAAKLLKRMDKDGSLNISFDEWRDFLLLAPSSDIHELVKYWRHSTNLRYNEAYLAMIGREVPSSNLLSSSSEISPPTVDALEKLNNKNIATNTGTTPVTSMTLIDATNNSNIPTTTTTSLGTTPDENLDPLLSLIDLEQAIEHITELILNPSLLKTGSSSASAFAGVHKFHNTHLLVDGKYLDIGEDLNVPDDFTQSEMQSGMWWRHLAAGGIAGAVSRTCTAPLDRLKVFLQVQSTKQRISDCLQYMLKEGGVRSLWRGNFINVLKIAPESAIKFAAYEQVKRLIRGNDKRQMTIYERFLAGACAGGVSQTAIYPLEVLKTRLALRKTGQYSSIMDAASKIYRREGLRSFYRGYIPNMLGIIPYAGIDLAVYETLKKKYLSHYETEQPSFWLLLACGSASSTLGQVCSYPLALVRTRLQAQAVTIGSQNPVDGIAAVEPNMTNVFKRILQTEGPLGLYRGITPNFIKVLPAVSISYVVYEYSSRALGVNMT